MPFFSSPGLILSFLILCALICCPDFSCPPGPCLQPRPQAQAQGLSVHLLGGPGHWVALRNLPLPVQPGARELPSPNPSPLPARLRWHLAGPAGDPRVILGSPPHLPQPSFQYLLSLCLLYPFLTNLDANLACLALISSPGHGAAAPGGRLP